MGNTIDSRKAGAEAPAKRSEVAIKTVSEEFMEELDDQEKEIFLNIKSVLMDDCELLEFEAVNEENLEDYSMLITYIKNGIVTIVDDGVNVKLRRPILNKDKEALTNNVTILFERNEAREKAFTKKAKLSKKDTESQKEYTRACLAASFKNVDFQGNSKMLSVDNTRGIHRHDYLLLLTCFNFFRN